MSQKGPCWHTVVIVVVAIFVWVDVGLLPFGKTLFLAILISWKVCSYFTFQEHLDIWIVCFCSKLAHPYKWRVCLIFSSNSITLKQMHDNEIQNGPDFRASQHFFAHQIDKTLILWQNRWQLPKTPKGCVAAESKDLQAEPGDNLNSYLFQFNHPPPLLPKLNAKKG